MAIDVASGDFLWSFGAGQDFDLFDAGGAPLGADAFMSCEHGLQYTPDDRLLVYDNGENRGYSRASAYQLDPANLEATLLWTWTESDWFETTLGSIDELPSGNVLIGAGHAQCFSSNPGDPTTVLEVDPVSGEKVWELKYTDIGVMAYRADWADPCALFANAKYCPAVGERLSTLATVLGSD